MMQLRRAHSFVMKCKAVVDRQVPAAIADVSHSSRSALILICRIVVGPADSLLFALFTGDCVSNWAQEPYRAVRYGEFHAIVTLRCTAFVSRKDTVVASRLDDDTKVLTSK